MNMMDMVRQLVLEGVEVTFKLNSEGAVVADLNSRTKSGMYLREDTRGLYVTGHYGERDHVSSLDDLLDIFVSRYFACNFGSDAWVAAAVKHGKMKVRTVTTEVVERA